MAVFLREDGQLALGTKTPVTILQETLQRKGISPHYELIYNGVGTPEPRFKISVSAEGFVAIGDGKSKKEAKHDAAAGLLKRMQFSKAVAETADSGNTSKEEMDIASPYSGALKTNYVGMLDEICVINKIPLSTFVPVREEGPPHARIFTMKCNVASVSEVAVARTKKQAKHLVAQQMINRIEGILGSRFSPLEEKEEGENANEEELLSRDLKAIENGTFKHDISFAVSDLHNVFHIRKDELPLPQAFEELPEKPERHYENLENPKEFLDSVLRALEGAVKVVHISRSTLEESLKQITFSSDDEEEEEEEVEDDIDDDFEITNSQQNKLLEKYILKDFIFDLPDDIEHCTTKSNETSETVDNSETSQHNSAVDSLCQRLDSSTLGFDDKTVAGANKDEVDSKPENNPESESVWVLLKVECPRGAWVFRGVGESAQKAIDGASIAALQFLRIMAIPPPSNTV